MLSTVGAIPDEEALSSSSPNTPHATDLEGEPEQGSPPGALEHRQAGHDMAATECTDRSGSMTSATAKSCDTGSVSSSKVTASADSGVSRGGGSESVWAACLDACKGRLNRMLLDCGIPSLPCQVRRNMNQQLLAAPLSRCITIPCQIWRIL